MREAEIRMKLEREIKASTDFIFGGTQERQVAGAGGRGGERLGGNRERRLELLDPNIRDPVPLNHQRIKQNADVNQIVAENSDVHVACPVCLFPVILATMDSHITTCMRESSAHPTTSEIVDISDIENVELVGADTGPGAVEVKTPSAQTGREKQCVVCWEPESPGDLRCPSGTHVICDGCLAGLVRALAEQTPAQLGDR